MPRRARKKHNEAIYHIMCRSSSEILLFRSDDDKQYFLGLLKRYSEKHKCSVYAYCLMDNHLHFHFDPKGYDISKFMHDLNTAYVRYYNKTYKRHGSVFQGRFESRIVDNDNYNFALSAYIHNNPQDIESFQGKEENYKYSPYGIYLGLQEDTLKLVDKSFMMGLFKQKDQEVFRRKDKEFVSHQRDVGEFEKLKKEMSDLKEYEYTSGRTVIVRDLSPAKVISYISGKLLGNEKMQVRSRKKLHEFRAFTAYVLKVLCGMKYKEICNSIYNITISGCSNLCDRGFELLNLEDRKYVNIYEHLMSHKI